MCCALMLAFGAEKALDKGGRQGSSHTTLGGPTPSLTSRSLTAARLNSVTGMQPAIGANTTASRCSCVGPVEALPPCSQLIFWVFCCCPKKARSCCAVTPKIWLAVKWTVCAVSSQVKSVQSQRLVHLLATPGTDP